jgi:hypothetical protein
MRFSIDQRKGIEMKPHLDEINLDELEDRIEFSVCCAEDSDSNNDEACDGGGKGGGDPESGGSGTG